MPPAGPPKPAAVSGEPEATASGDSGRMCTMQRRAYLRRYYQSLFPLHLFGVWLGGGRAPLRGEPPCPEFRRREFSFSFGEVMTRFVTFADLEELKNYLVQKLPDRIDLGAVYSENPREKLLAPVPVRREFVLDFDMTDMPHAIFSECADPGKEGYGESWLFCVAAMRVLDAALREDFGFEALLWVRSGAKGVHCWVGDERACLLSDAARHAIVAYLQCYSQGEQTPGSEHAVHPSLLRACDIVDKSGLWERMLAQQLWLSDERRPALVALIEKEGMREWVGGELDEVPPHLRSDMGFMWKKLCNLVCNWKDPHDRKAYKKGLRGVGKRPNVLLHLKLRMAYPVLDVKVSEQCDHLLKAPFSLHPKTLRVCVPIDPAEEDDLKEPAPPTLQQVCEDPALLRGPRKVFERAFVAPLRRAALGRRGALEW